MRKIQMHDKLRKFERDSGIEIFGLGAKRHLWEAALEKYAELIVQECARVYWNIDNGETHTEYVEALKQHFGVEE
jgi:hypothetical protein